MGGNTFTAAEAANIDAVSREECNLLENTYQNKYPQGRNDCTPRSGAIAIFSNLTPLKRGTKNHTERVRVGSFPFAYISKIDIIDI